MTTVPSELWRTKQEWSFYNYGSAKQVFKDQDAYLDTRIVYYKCNCEWKLLCIYKTTSLHFFDIACNRPTLNNK